MKKILIGLLVTLLVLVLIGIMLLLLNMIIHNQCMQLTPSEYYESSLCERYWNSTDWEAVKQWFGR